MTPPNISGSKYIGTLNRPSDHGGCIENFIPGKQPPWSDGRFNVPMYFEPLMFGGVTLRNPDYIGPDTGSLASLKTMEDFLHAFHLQLEYGISEYFMFFNNENDRYNNENYAQPFLSIFCEDCIGRARDILDGGAKYPSAHGAGSVSYTHLNSTKKERCSFICFVWHYLPVQ